MTEIKITKQFDLEDRTFKFSQDVRIFVRILPKDFITIEDARQLIKASGSIGANYIEANEALSKKDFYHRIKICRKESKESKYWLRLIVVNNKELLSEQKRLIQEAVELMRIFGSILEKKVNKEF